MLHLPASDFAAAATVLSCFCRAPSFSSSVLPSMRNSIQFSSRSLANTKTTWSNSSVVIPAFSATSRNLAFKASPSSMSWSKSAHTISVVSAPISRHIRSSAGILSIYCFLPPQSTGRTILLPFHGRIQAGLSAFSNARIKTGSILRARSPSCRHTICVRLATNPPPRDCLSHTQTFRNFQRPDTCR